MLSISLFYKALLKAEKFQNMNIEKTRDIFKTKTDLDQAYVDYMWPRNFYSIQVDQDLITTLEDIYQWRTGTEDKILDFTEKIDTSILQKLAPEKVTINPK